MANPWTARRLARGLRVGDPGNEALALRLMCRGCSQREYSDALGLSLKAIYRREKMNRVPSEARLFMEWLAGSGERPSGLSWMRADELRKPGIYRLAREAMKLGQAGLAGELGVSLACISNRENGRGAIGREAAYCMVILAERLRIRRIDADQALTERYAAALDDATG